MQHLISERTHGYSRALVKEILAIKNEHNIPIQEIVLTGPHAEGRELEDSPINLLVICKEPSQLCQSTSSTWEQTINLNVDEYYQPNIHLCTNHWWETKGRNEVGTYISIWKPKPATNGSK